MHLGNGLDTCIEPSELIKGRSIRRHVGPIREASIGISGWVNDVNEREGFGARNLDAEHLDHLLVRGRKVGFRSKRESKEASRRNRFQIVGKRMGEG